MMIHGKALGRWGSVCDGPSGRRARLIIWRVGMEQ